MKAFFVDYANLWRESMSFLKAHWLGVIIFTLILFVIEMFIVFPQWITYTFEKVSDTVSAIFDKN